MPRATTVPEFGQISLMARNLAEMVSNGVTPEGDCVDAGEFWSAVEISMMV